jgi:hypothetical protein
MWLPLKKRSSFNKLVDRLRKVINIEYELVLHRSYDIGDNGSIYLMLDPCTQNSRIMKNPSCIPQTQKFNPKSTVVKFFRSCITSQSNTPKNQSEGGHVTLNWYNWNISKHPVANRTHERNNTWRTAPRQESAAPLVRRVRVSSRVLAPVWEQPKK